MLEIDPDGRDDLIVGAAEDRVTVLALPRARGFAEPPILGLEEVRGFLTVSETEARTAAGVAIGLLFEPTEPVEEARRVGSSGLVVVGPESDCLARDGALAFAGTTDILRVGKVVGLEDVDDTKAGFEPTEGGDVVDFFKTGALDLVIPAVVGLDTVGLREPEPNVPEFNTC